MAFAARSDAGVAWAEVLQRRAGAPVPLASMATQSETLQVTGIRCERCVNRLAATLQGHEGLESANANLMGLVSLQFDDAKTSRDSLVAAMAKAGFREIAE
jgi:copper chaperone CopZ